MNTQEKIQQAAKTAARLHQLSQADKDRREALLSFDNLLTADADSLIAELASLDARMALYPQLIRLHSRYQKEFLAGVRETVH